MLVRLDGKLNEIWYEHPNRVSEAETAGYIWNHLFYGLRKPLWESICTKCNNPLNNYMTPMWVVRKAKGEHEQEKHNTSYVSKSGTVNDASPTKQVGNDNQDTKNHMQEPSQSGSKYNSSWWQLLKKLKECQKPSDRISIGVRGRIVRTPALVVKCSSIKAPVKNGKAARSN